MELFDYIKSQLPQMPNSAIMKQMGASEELIDYVKKTPWNTNLNMMVSIAGSGGGGDAEVWLTSDTYIDAGERTFTLSNVGEVDHITELFNNADNYKVYLNGEELPYLTSESAQGMSVVRWVDSETEADITKYVLLIDSSGTKQAAAYYLDISTAPTSVEVSVKAK